MCWKRTSSKPFLYKHRLAKSVSLFRTHQKNISKLLLDNSPCNFAISWKSDVCLWQKGTVILVPCFATILKKQHCFELGSCWWVWYWYCCPRWCRWLSSLLSLLLFLRLLQAYCFLSEGVPSLLWKFGPFLMQTPNQFWVATCLSRFVYQSEAVR